MVVKKALRMQNDINIFINDFCKELRENNVAIFVGSGLSVPAGCVDWKGLLKDLAEELSLDIKKEYDLVALGQYYCNENGGNRGRMNQKLLSEFCGNAQITENHKILARLPITTFWTTNYDTLIENSLKAVYKIPDVKHDKRQLAVTMPKRDATVYKMHGDASHPDDAVIIKDDYERYHIDREPFITALSGDLVSKTFLFLGFSFTDPNLDYIFSRIRANFAKHQRQHFCFMKTIKGAGANAVYKRRKQELFINDLRRFNIKTLLVDKYSEITRILRTIESIYKRKTVFISGSAVQYGVGKWKEKESQNLIHNLAKKLIGNDYRLVSGFGLGVGSFVVNGALSEIYSQKHRSSKEQLVLRPFPQNKTGKKDLSQMWKEYRQEMIPEAGVAIFLFGNKENNGKVVVADGVRKEFEIAKKNGLKLLPVGATGYMAKRLWDIVDMDFDKYFPQAQATTKKKWRVIGDPSKTPTTVINAVFEILEELNQE